VRERREAFRPQPVGLRYERLAVVQQDIRGSLGPATGPGADDEGNGGGLGRAIGRKTGCAACAPDTSTATALL